MGWGQSDGTSVLGRVMKADEEGEETVVDGLLLEIWGHSHCSQGFITKTFDYASSALLNGI